ncbi:MAG: SprT-like domain-containing protein [Bacteroidales bacterium]|nr:SprT-like domain-containing protein [Bacteroidales bacterium]
MIKQYKDILNKYLPENSVDIILEWVALYKINLRISKGRTTKLGDYRPPAKNNTHRISINHDLNKYSFLITVVHEIAHLIVWEKYKNTVKPHGQEWKSEFKFLMYSFMNNKIFPPDIFYALSKYLNNAFASSSADLELSRILNKYDNNKELILEDLPLHSIFRINNGKTFKKLERLRKRYRCISMDNKRVYLVNPLAKVIPIK